MARPRKYSDAQLKAVDAARKTGSSWAELQQQYGPGVKAAYYYLKNRKEKPRVAAVTVWYPASWYAEHGLPSPYK